MLQSRKRANSSTSRKVLRGEFTQFCELIYGNLGCSYMAVSAYPNISPHFHMYCSMSDPRYSFNCDVTSIFDLRTFCLLGSGCFSASRLYYDSSFLVGFRVHPDRRGVSEGDSELKESCSHIGLNMNQKTQHE